VAAAAVAAAAVAAAAADTTMTQPGKAAAFESPLTPHTGESIQKKKKRGDLLSVLQFKVLKFSSPTEGARGGGEAAQKDGDYEKWGTATTLSDQFTGFL